MGEIKFTNGIIMAALFAVCILTFSINFAMDNDSVISVGNDGSLNATSTQIQGDLITFNSSINSAGKSFQEEVVTASTFTSTAGGQFQQPAKASYGTAVKTMTNSFNYIFGSDFAILSVTLISVLSFMAIRYAYKTWFGKNPD